MQHEPYPGRPEPSEADDLRRLLEERTQERDEAREPLPPIAREELVRVFYAAVPNPSRTGNTLGLIAVAHLCGREVSGT
jgi:hypothetical protein